MGYNLYNDVVKIHEERGWKQIDEEFFWETVSVRIERQRGNSKKQGNYICVYAW